ncbi:hypothetical protein H4219_004192 [Mycoemilia scoparia]|uniref:EF-hand domain-containing protein n=1 Tax=Mycoemilia scoparia TaxID=417184 RepID=A0A9W7ZY87_9FUNG|nr:hypothetical protein H4219_004192 [Mycoemilia scoparia]
MSTLERLPSKLLFKIGNELDLYSLIELLVASPSLYKTFSHQQFWYRRYTNDFDNRRVILKLLSDARFDVSEFSAITKYGLTCKTLELNEGVPECYTDEDTIDISSDIEISSDDENVDHVDSEDQSQNIYNQLRWKHAYRLRYDIVYPNSQILKNKRADLCYALICKVKDLIHDVENPDTEADDLFKEIIANILSVLDYFPQHFECYHLLGFLCYLNNSLSESQAFLEIGLSLNPKFQPLIELHDEVTKIIKGNFESDEGQVPLLFDENTLSPQLNEVIAVLFSRFDKDQDGMLSVSELSELVSVSNGSIPNPNSIKQLIATFEGMHKNNSRHIGVQPTKLSRDGLTTFFLMQSIEDPEETRSDLKKFGFDPKTLQPL